MGGNGRVHFVGSTCRMRSGEAATIYLDLPLVLFCHKPAQTWHLAFFKQCRVRALLPLRIMGVKVGQGGMSLVGDMSLCRPPAPSSGVNRNRTVTWLVWRQLARPLSQHHRTRLHDRGKEETSSSGRQQQNQAPLLPVCCKYWPQSFFVILTP